MLISDIERQTLRTRNKLAITSIDPHIANLNRAFSIKTHRESMLTKKQQTHKRIFDVVLSVVLLPFLLIPLALLLSIATFHFRRSGLFVQERIGQHGKRFNLYKIRSLSGERHKDVIAINTNLSSFGKWLRNSKLDELPQLFNVLKGEMSWVGPRPDIPGYADKLMGDDRVILSLKPGITGPATIRYKNEDAVLMEQDNPNKYNDEVIWPDKVRLNKEYACNWSIASDVKYIIRSIF